MKFEQINVVADGEIVKALDQLVAESERQSDAATKIGTYPNMLSAIRKGNAGIAAKVLDYFGLEERRVIVAKNQVG